MKITFAILGFFVALFCSPMNASSATNCTIQVIYNQSKFFCDYFKPLNVNFCTGFTTSISNQNIEAFLATQEKIFCSLPFIPFIGYICDVCNFSTIFSQNENITIATGNSTTGSTRILGVPTLIAGGPA
ncbi:uncharacterized protein [Drosophila takahashii]|uniref:uncharacterized protein n=1 Tax=Drosophila takahashii TaxID=29030 RepID=UPI001CF8DCF6|nr:uncharacterized protein LOC108060303 [Drosophila takahashii]